VKSLKLLRLMLLILVLCLLVMAGCTKSADQYYTEGSQSVEIAGGEQFTIRLESNITTGYQWEVEYDDSLLALLESEYVPDDENGPPGSGGAQFFTFEGLNAGVTEIVLVYKQSWMEEIDQELVFSVTIK
jgi:predicted secreted protein